MASIKEFQRKIGSLRNSRKITGSMKMISSIKLQKVAALAEKSATFRSTARALEGVLRHADTTGYEPVINGYRAVKNIEMLLITGDRGLCGRFNANAINLFMREVAAHREKGQEIAMSAIGLRGAAFLKRRGFSCTHYTGIIGNPDWEKVRAAGTELFNRFIQGTTQELWVVYTRRKSSISEEPCVERLLPYAIEDPGTASVNYVCDVPKEFIRTTADLLTRARVFDAVISSALAEHAARMSAMDNANSNCDRLIDKYTQLRNRARQAVITTELNEIVTGKEALEA